ncbi:virulence factor SrfB [Thorsellia kenyensis]|uniref:Virulence factor SrfB n=1 Tax=Thorsellia kenyensis TaxID=1549888 RepID=A0ABV6C6H1_9GAMM
MLAPLIDFKDKVTLIEDSGIQCLDFGIDANIKKMRAGEFIKSPLDGTLVRLVFDERKEGFVQPGTGFPAQSQFDMPLEQSLNLLNGIWLPIPYFRISPPRQFIKGPLNWVRAQIIKLDDADNEGNTYRVVFAFDTKVFTDSTHTQYLAPTREDINSGVNFGLAARSNEHGDYLNLTWVNDWLIEVFKENALSRLRMHTEDIEESVTLLHHQAHYLNFLSILDECLRLPDIQVTACFNNKSNKSIGVDLLLDVGNSRTCGIMVEHHEADKETLEQIYELKLRDLTTPHNVYIEPFESRVEFAQAEFGKKDFCMQSGRHDAFTWPTMTRIGGEAVRLAAQRLGTEGSTGISSPKRYLWDEDSFEAGWRFNKAFVKSDHEPLATAAPLISLINDTGEALYTLEPHERIPVFSPKYCRSSLMTFMLCEVLSHAIIQMNSVSQRLQMSHAVAPRYLKNIILTIPPSMPKPERQIFEKRMQQAIGLVWKSMGWHNHDDKVMRQEEEPNVSVFTSMPIPRVNVQWDEATCGQMVYLYNETQHRFDGRSEEFFAALARPDKKELLGETFGKTLNIASIDIGGGTTDLVITHYKLDEGKGSNVGIEPFQLFRDGFKIAGDDILLDVIQLYVIPMIEGALKRVGLSQPSSLLSRLFGSERVTAQQQVLRQQLTLQLLSPLGLKILSLYEKYDPAQLSQPIDMKIIELLGEHQKPTENVLGYFYQELRKELNQNHLEFNLLDVSISFDLAHLHQAFLTGRMNITESLKALSEVVYHYGCDVLLLTGRPSRLPGVQALLNQLQPVPSTRILPLQGYYTGEWYPFNKQGRIDDPKSTAAVGAMLCLLADKLKLPNFYFKASNFKPYSTVRYLGMLDNSNLIKKENVYYKEVDLDSPDSELDDEVFELRGTMRLGYRQFNIERWPASALFSLTIQNDKIKEEIARGGLIRVSLRTKRNKTDPNMKVSSQHHEQEIHLNNAELFNREGEPVKTVTSALKLQLNTLADTGLGATHYWMDSGRVITK